MTQRETIEPFPAAYRRGAIDAVRKCLGTKRRSIISLLNDPNFVALLPPSQWSDRTFINLNTPDDVERFNQYTST